MTYTSKAAQNRDLDALNREYSRITDNVKAFELPFYLYEIRAKRLDAVQEAGHVSAELRAEIERLIERRAEIKATPIVKPTPRGPAKPPVSDLGTCQVCGRSIRTPNGRIAEHGYRRMNWGFNVNSCYGSRAKSFDVSRAALGEWIEIVRRQIDGLRNKTGETLRERREIDRQLNICNIELKHQIERFSNWATKQEAA
jgi:hypothetical protein